MHRTTTFTTTLATLCLAAFILTAATPASAQNAAIKRTTLVKQDAPIAGYQSLMNIVEIPPGVSEVRHTHPGPLFLYVLEGTISVEQEGKETTTYKAGDAFVIGAGKIHKGTNVSNVPVKLVGTLVFESGKPPSTPVRE
ncbi:MAG TPA: cupin domain-containing protein [Pseudolabrys sp.]|nr:cupin domain-containing protein [Pseudolabrys sp.]